MALKAAVVGGGIAGIVSALLLRRRGYEVTLIERAAELGGLLRSVHPFGQNYSFDYGTHLMRESGIKSLDSLLFDGLDTTILATTRAGSFHSKLFDGNAFLADFGLPENLRATGLQALINRQDRTGFATLEDELLSSFGTVYADELFTAIVRKHFAREPAELTPGSHNLFGLGRLVAGNPQQTRDLKKIAKHDEVLAYHSHDEMVSSLRSLYPTQGGMGAWIEHLENKLEAASVDIFRTCQVHSIERGEGGINAIDTSAGRFSIDHLVWSAPLFALLNAMDEPLTGGGPHPRLSSIIQHILVDENYATDLYYLHCYDPLLDTFRVTLYDNFNPRHERFKRITVEHLSALKTLDAKQSDSLRKQTIDELKTMGVIKTTTSVVDHSLELMANGFPIPTHEFSRAAKAQFEQSSQLAHNLSLVGKGNGNVWFMNEVLADVHQQICEL